MKKRWLLSKKSSFSSMFSFHSAHPFIVFFFFFNYLVLFSFSFSRPFNESFLLLCIGKEIFQGKKGKKLTGSFCVFMDGRARQKI